MQLEDVNQHVMTVVACCCANLRASAAPQTENGCTALDDGMRVLQVNVLTGMAEMVTRSLEKDWIADRRRRSAKMLLSADVKVVADRLFVLTIVLHVRCSHQQCDTDTCVQCVEVHAPQGGV